MTLSTSLSTLLSSLILLSGDVELNPGPPGPRSSTRRETKPDKQKILEDRVHALETLVTSLEEKQKASLERALEIVRKEQMEKEVDLRTTLESVEVDLRRTMESVEVTSSSALTTCHSHINEHVGRLEKSTSMELSSLHSHLSELSMTLERGLESLSSRFEEQSDKQIEMESELEEVQEKLWHMDKSWKNNLVFYGLKSDNSSSETQMEGRVRDVIKHKLQISREMSIVRVRRSFNGPEVRGSRPVVVHFEKYSDKEEVLRKSKLLKGSSVYVEEDFSKRVRDQRLELQRFMRQLRLRRPDSKFHLQFDRLLVDNDVFVFNENTGKVEELNLGLIYDDVRSRSSTMARQRVVKAASAEADLNHINESPQKSRSASPTKSPTKSAPRHRHQVFNDELENSREDKTKVEKNREEENVKVEEEEEEESTKEFMEEPTRDYSSPMRRLSVAIIPETIPE